MWVCPITHGGCGTVTEDYHWPEDHDPYCIDCGDVTFIPVKDACVTDFTDAEDASKYAGPNIPNGRRAIQP